MNTPVKPLAQNPDIRYLGRLLGDVIRAYGGDRLFERIESIRASSVDRHRGVDRQRGGGDAGSMDRGLDALSLDDTLAFVRGFMLFSMLANLAEDRQGGLNESGEDVAAALQRLAAKGVGCERAAELLDAALIVPHEDGQWRFAHALIHDAAYAGLLASRRRVLHERLADRLERGPEPSTPSQIAAHRVAAGDVSRAIPLLREAAESALALGAVAEAVASWRQAADLAAADDPAGAEIDRARAAEAVIAFDSFRELVGQEQETPAQEAPAIGPS